LLVHILPACVGHRAIGENARREVVHRVRRDTPHVAAVPRHGVEHRHGERVVAQDHPAATGRDEHDAAIGQIARVDVVILAVRELPSPRAVQVHLIDAARRWSIGLVGEHGALAIPRHVRVTEDTCLWKPRRHGRGLAIGPQRRECGQTSSEPVAPVEVGRVNVARVIRLSLGEQQLPERQQRIAQCHAALEAIGRHIQVIHAAPLGLVIGRRLEALDLGQKCSGLVARLSQVQAPPAAELVREEARVFGHPPDPSGIEGQHACVGAALRHHH